MKDMLAVYPGSFCPPTFGHFNIVSRAALMFQKLVVLCSENPEKTGWFSQEECKEMWLSYPLPKNVTVETFESLKEQKTDPRKIVMIRGIRNAKDFEDEAKVAMYNKERFGICNFTYLMCEKEYECVSSSATREAAQNLELEKLHRFVNPRIVGKLLEKVLEAKNVFMVVGKPGCGKSTFLKTLEKIDANNLHINTDEFSEAIKPTIFKHFGGGANLVTLAVEKDEELSGLIAKEWFRMLKERLRAVPNGSNVFVEIPYGLRPGKEMFRFIGNKLIYIGCEDRKANRKRIIGRGTPEHIPFAKCIPGRNETRKIARRNRLRLAEIDTNCSLEELEIKAREFNLKFKGGNL
jgi:pantetheine-phosphate adenylyltransferase